jgi:hypothetical protein
MQNDQAMPSVRPTDHTSDAFSPAGRRAGESGPPLASSTDGEEEAENPPSLLSRIHGGAPQYRRSLFRR